jgi:hypothetical protein
MSAGGEKAAGADQVLQSTCEKIVTMIAQTIDAEPAGGVTSLRLPEGPVIGRQMTIDASDRDKEGKLNALNLCRISMLNSDLAPEAEVARLEYEHDRLDQFGMQRVYSVQTIRRRAGQLVMFENFLAGRPEAVREQDFRPIHSEAYAQEMMKEVGQWTRYRAAQLEELHRVR